jgi:iron complex outermembrane receptor protein
MPGWTLDAGALLQHQRWQGPVATTPPGNDPRRQLSAGSKWTIGSEWEAGVAVRHVSALRTPALPAYTAVDARVGWHLSPTVELRLSGTDLFHRGHAEFRSSANAIPVRIERAVALTLTVRLP